MNLLARILSHGFALVVVVLIAVILMYRGELFPEWELPEFLVADNDMDSGAADQPATADHAAPETAAQTETPDMLPAEVPRVEAPGEAVVQGVVAPSEEALSTVDDATMESDPGTAVVDDVADTDTMPEAPLTAAPAAPRETAADRDAPASTPDTPTVIEPQTMDEPDQTEALQVDPSVADMTGNDAAGAETTLEAPLTATPASVPETAVAASTDGVPASAAADEPAVIEPQAVDEPGQTEAARTVPSAADTASSDVAGTEATLEETLIDAPATPVEAVTAAAADASASTADAPVVIAPQAVDVPDQVEATPAAPPAPGMASDDVTGQLAAPVQDIAAAAPPAETVPDSEPEPAVTEMPLAPPGDSTGKTANELLAAAREAYWLHNYELAETHYQQLIQLEPGNPDGYGELANMYFALGQWEEAAAAYYAAGVRFVKDGMVAEARQMVDVIRGLNGAQADELEEQIDAGQ